MEKHKKLEYNNSKSKISAPTWNDKFELPDGLYSMSDIQDYFEHIKKNMEKRLIIVHEEYIYIYINKVKNRITFKIKIGYYLKLLTLETMKLLGTTENRITKGKKL